MSILAPSAAGLWKVIESYRIDPRPLFAAEGIEIELPIKPGSRLPYAKVDRIRARAAALSGDPAFGLRWARYVHPSHFGALGYAWMACSTLRQGLKNLHRYVRVLNDHASVSMKETDGALVVRIDVEEGSENRIARDDSQLAALVSLSRMNYGPEFCPVWVGLSHAEPADITAYAELFGCPLHWGRDGSEFAVSTIDADRMLPTANPVLEQMNERVVMKRLAELDRADTVTRARAVIMEQLPSGGITDESVADALHMTSRTLHRRLKDQAYSFRDLLKEVRQDLAAQYINDESLTLTEISFLLGFSEISSFSRAFKNWNGVSPSEARQSIH